MAKCLSKQKKIFRRILHLRLFLTYEVTTVLRHAGCFKRKKTEEEENSFSENIFMCPRTKGLFFKHKNTFYGESTL